MDIIISRLPLHHKPQRSSQGHLVRPGIVKVNGAVILVRTASISLCKKDSALTDKGHMRIVVICRGSTALCIISMRSDISNENKFTRKE
jgi:hypothetical protein